MSIYDSIATAANSGTSCAICTIIETKGTTPRNVGSKMIVYQNGDTEGSVGGGLVEKEIKEAAIIAISNESIIRRIFLIDSTVNKDDDFIEVLIEPIRPCTTIVIVGAGHIGKVSACIAKKLGWHVIIVDDRADFCNKANIDVGDEFYLEINDINQNIILRKSNYFVFCTRSSEIDLKILPRVIDCGPKYIGVLGSAKRWKTTEMKLLEKGFSVSQIESISTPIGIDINAETPEEIAVSIIAQIIKINNHSN